MRNSMFFVIADELRKFLESTNPGYVVSTNPDVDFYCRPVVYFNGNKGNGDFFMGSYRLERFSNGGNGSYYALTCPEYNTKYFKVNQSYDDDREVWIVALIPQEAAMNAWMKEQVEGA